ncbi:MAG: alpha/beta hydrolase [Paracoccaceae bacterium]
MAKQRESHAMPSLTPADYAELLDVETMGYQRRTESFYPPETDRMPITEQRTIYAALCQAFHHPYPDHVRARDERLGDVACRFYQSDRPAAGDVTVLYLHGGGFVMGNLESHDSICAEICGQTGLRLVSADYRLAPEYLHPAQFDDCLSVLRAIAARWPHGSILIAGDSAGASLGAALCHHARRDRALRICGQVMIYPMLLLDIDTKSCRTHAQAPALSTEAVDYYNRVRSPDGTLPHGDTRYFPLADHDFSGLPPTVIFTAECDPLVDDGPAYCNKLSAAGGKALLREEKGLIHGYLRARHSVARAAASFTDITATISALAQGRFPE